MSDEACKQIADDVIELCVSSSEDAQRVAEFLRVQNKFQEVVPGLSSVSVMFDPIDMPAAFVTREMQRASALAPHMSADDASIVEIPVRYGGDAGLDLSYVCDLLGISESDFIRSHTAADHAVDMIGFTPGFAYISGLDAAFNVPRQSTPRPRLPAGSVGISGAYTGIYALAGPGGWPVIGQTDLNLFDPSADSPFLLRPGQRICFKAV